MPWKHSEANPVSLGKGHAAGVEVFLSRFGLPLQVNQRLQRRRQRVIPRHWGRHAAFRRVLIDNGDHLYRLWSRSPEYRGGGGPVKHPPPPQTT